MECLGDNCDSFAPSATLLKAIYFALRQEAREKVACSSSIFKDRRLQKLLLKRRGETNGTLAITHTASSDSQEPGKSDETRHGISFSLLAEAAADILREPLDGDLIESRNEPRNDYWDYVSFSCSGDPKDLENSAKGVLGTESNRSELPGGESGFCTSLSLLRNRNGVRKSMQSSDEGFEQASNMSRESIRKGTELPVSKIVPDIISSEVEEIYEKLRGNVKKDAIAVVLGMRVKTDKDFISDKHIAGLHHVKKIIEDKIINSMKRRDLYKGLYKPPRGILLFGPPGTGKTLIAKWISNLSGATFFEMSPGNLISKYYGETEYLIKALFDVAKAFERSIIFIDEIDSLLSKRVSEEGDFLIRMKNQCLQEMDGMMRSSISESSRANGCLSNSLMVIIGATNRPSTLDAAAIRRFNKRVYVPLPDLESRAMQIQNLLFDHYSSFSESSLQEPVPEQNMLSGEDLRDISLRIEGWNGSDIQALCVKASDYCYDEALEKYGDIENVPNAKAFRPITHIDFLRALEVVKPSAVAKSDIEELEMWNAKFGCA